MPGSRKKPDVTYRPLGLVGSASARPSLLYRLLRRLFALVVGALFRVEVEGRANLPREAGRAAGGWIACGVPHRTWVEFFILLAVLPAEPRLIMLGDGPTIFGSAWRRALMRRVGGVVPIWRGSGPRAFEAHMDAAQQAIAAGAVFGLFPEMGHAARPPALRKVSSSVAYFALRTGAPIVPFVFGGTHELFWRRRIIVRILPAIEPAQPTPVAGTPVEKQAVDELLARLLASVEPEVADAHAAADPLPGARKLARWLTGPYPGPD